MNIAELSALLELSESRVRAIATALSIDTSRADFAFDGNQCEQVQYVVNWMAENRVADPSQAIELIRQEQIVTPMPELATSVDLNEVKSVALNRVVQFQIASNEMVIYFLENGVSGDDYSPEQRRAIQESNARLESAMKKRLNHTQSFLTNVARGKVAPPITIPSTTQQSLSESKKR